MGQSYRDLIAWQKAMALVTDVYPATRRFPGEEQYGLTTQLRRAAVLIPSKIAEARHVSPPVSFITLSAWRGAPLGKWKRTFRLR
jgi:hypothetical protein